MVPDHWTCLRSHLYVTSFAHFIYTLLIISTGGMFMYDTFLFLGRESVLNKPYVTRLSHMLPTLTTCSTEMRARGAFTHKPCLQSVRSRVSLVSSSFKQHLRADVCCLGGLEVPFVCRGIQTTHLSVVSEQLYFLSASPDPSS